ncbi:MAG: hypothetical protein AB1349_10060 [Elusimicrobiota bacterium]
MKKRVIEIIEEKFKKDIKEIQYQLWKNKREINVLAQKQNELKGVRAGLYGILRQIKGTHKHPENREV